VLELRLHRPEQALRPLQKAVEIEPSSPGGLYNLGAAYLDLDLLDRSIEVLTRGIGYWPADARFYSLLGLAYLQKHDTARAEVAFEEALRIDPRDAMAKDQLAKLRSTAVSGAPAGRR
jgi:predicted Zn-dependent protease